MGTSRHAAIPIDHAIAEMAAFPIASETALRLAIAELVAYPSLDRNTAKLWREAESQALGGFPAFSVDEVVTLRDETWFEGEPDDAFPTRVPLHRYVRRLARCYLEIRGTHAVPTLPGERVGHASTEALHLLGLALPGSPEARARRFWRWLSFALPPDLLLAAAVDSPAALERIELVSPVLRQDLQDRGYAETHQHVGAGMDFGLFWISALRAIADPNSRHTAFESPGAAFDEGRNLGPWLVRAAIARYLLAAYLCREDLWARGLSAFLDGEVLDTVAERAGAENLPVLSLVLGDMLQGNLTRSGPSYASFQGLYRQLSDIAYWEPLATTIEQVHKADPIAPVVGWDRFGRPSPEMRFLGCAFRYLGSHPKDSLFPVLFWQVVRVRNLLYRHVVQRPMTPGMQWFIRFYGRIGPGSRPLKRPLPERPEYLLAYRNLQLESAARLAGITTGLRSLEVRTSPDTSESDLLRYITNVDETFYWLSEDLGRRGPRGHPERPVRELGFVLHFTKDRGGGARQGRPTAHGIYSNADPRWFPDEGSSRPFGNPTGYRYARFFNEKMMEARSLASVLRRFPMSLETIRGIDVATDELGVPTWVIALLFRYVRKAGIAASETLRRRLGHLVPPLRATAHAGEDFIHLVTGLRHVDEAITRLELREGDRIGHGVALGVDPHAWCHRAGRIAVAREERLFDVVWELSWYGRGGLEPPRGRVHRIEREVARLSQAVFGLTISPFDMELLIECLYSEHWLFRIARFPHGPPPYFLERDRQGPAMLCLRYLTDGWVFRKGQELEWIDPRLEAEALAGLQAAVRRKLGERGITVEVNPSSNLLIGDLGDLAQHPLWRLNPPPGVKVDAPPVCICIGSDNPLTFTTTLPEEYQLLLDALVLAGCSEEQARQWLNRVRETGLENRFTVPRSGLSITSMMNP